MRVIWVILPALVVALFTPAAPAAEKDAAPVVFEAAGAGTAVVAHPQQKDGRILAVDVTAVSGTHRLKATTPKLAAGCYRVTLYTRLYSAANDDLSRVRIEWTVGDGRKPLTKDRFAWTQFDASPNRFTPLELEITLPAGGTPTFDFAWQQISTGPTDKPKPLRKIEVPNAPKLEGTAKKKPGAGDDLLAELDSGGKPAPFASVIYPAVLIERAVIEPISRTQIIESVRPQFLHVYPEQANPIDVVVRNFENRSVAATVQLELRAGLEDVLHSATQTVTLTPGATTSCRFEPPAMPREFGREARATLMVDGRPVHVASDYYSASKSIWTVALQGSGFLDFYGREPFLAEHVNHNRTSYLNVEEAFSWQPSSWTDLTPETEHWWTGQGDAHNSLAGLKQWIALSHEQGIKMITYLWPSASGPEALEWAREAPELITHVGVGLAAEFWDVEDLRLKAITEADPRLWELRSGIWNNVGLNRGMLRAIDKGMAETIESTRRFGWDGARFDSPPGWSAMGAADMHAEFARLDVEPLVRKVVPEYINQKEGTWTDEAVSVTNARFTRARLRAENPHFELSYNFGAIEEKPGVSTKFYDACCAEGGQIMDEAIRLMTRAPWLTYLTRLREQADITRRRGGSSCVVAPSAPAPASRCYTGICVLAGGSHPYGDFGWNLTMPGKYSQFMTRYGEFCWATDLEWIEAEKSGFTVEEAERYFWGQLIRQRPTSDGGRQYVVHLISTPPSDLVIAENPRPMQPWRQDLKVERRADREPTVWALSADPATHAERLKPVKSGDRYVVEIPEHRVWTVVVWTEPAPGKGS